VKTYTCSVDLLLLIQNNSFLQLPSLIKNGSTNTRTFIYHNIGILFGALVIILLSVFESKIEIHWYWFPIFLGFLCYPRYFDNFVFILCIFHNFLLIFGRQNFEIYSAVWTIVMQMLISEDFHRNICHIYAR
jgi:hypothetical protein